MGCRTPWSAREPVLLVCSSVPFKFKALVGAQESWALAPVTVGSHLMPLGLGFPLGLSGLWARRGTGQLFCAAGSFSSVLP